MKLGGDTVADLGSTTAVTLWPNPRTRWERPLLNGSNHAPAPQRAIESADRRMSGNSPGSLLPTRLPQPRSLPGRALRLLGFRASPVDLLVELERPPPPR